MYQRMSVVFAAVLLLTKIHAALAVYQLEFQLISYNNSMGRRLDGTCCVLQGASGVCRVDLPAGTCDTSFLLSLRNVDTSQTFPMQEVLTADYVDQDYIDFPSCGMIPNGYTNPLVFTLSASEWTVGDTLRLNLQARDSEIDFLGLPTYFPITNIAIDIVRPAAPDATFQSDSRTSANGVSLESRYRVICTDGSCGSDCTDTNNCTPFPDACADCIPNPCQNGGNCNVDVTSGYTCSCPVGFIGFNCEQQDPCIPNPCQNGGVCAEDGGGGYTCSSCNLGYTGTNCETDLCTPNPCENQGTCNRLMDAISCDCLGGYSGATCQMDVFCSSDPCQNGGECSGDTCSCQTGFTGSSCEIDIDLCASDPCLNTGTCDELANDDRGYVCTCPMEYIGNNCEIPNPCFPNPCQNQGTCQADGGSVNCLCTFEWEGDDCSTPRNASCDPNPCLNGGTCMMSESSIMCVCPPNFTGITCGITDSQDCLVLGLLTCSDGGCYNETERCDTIRQCADGSDEDSCPRGTGDTNVVAIAVGVSVGSVALICVIAVTVIAVVCIVSNSARAKSRTKTTTVVAGTLSSNEQVIPMKMTSTSGLESKEKEAGGASTFKKPMLPPQAYPGSTGY